MDDIHRHDRIGDTISAADDLRIQAANDGLGAVVNILIYTPCFSLISIGIYNSRDHACQPQEDEPGVLCHLRCHHPSLRHRYQLHHGLHIKEWLYVMLVLFCGSVSYCIYMIMREMIRRKNMLETMAATDMLPYVRYSRASVLILWLSACVMPFAILSTTLLYNRTYCTVCPAVLPAFHS